MFKAILVAACLAAVIPVEGSQSHDRDLSSSFYPEKLSLQLNQEGRVKDGKLVFPIERVSEKSDLAVPAGVVVGKFLLVDANGKESPARYASATLLCSGVLGGSAQTDKDGAWAIPLPLSARGPCILNFSLDNHFWKFKNPDNRSYEWEGPVVPLTSAGYDAGIFRLNPQTKNSEVGFIHRTYTEAVDFFVREKVNLNWWNRTLKVSWPANADYFQSIAWGVYLTNAKAWDVNLHEFGHMVVAAATDSSGGGGQHKIDECYDAELAWTEGFPTFLAAAIHLDKADKDAKFEYLVPRRAPIRIENVPADVCHGVRNEWRLAAGVWDIYDTNEDGQDKLALSFIRLWNSILGQRIEGVHDAIGLIEKGLSADEFKLAQSVWIQNTLNENFANSKVRKPKQRDFLDLPEVFEGR